MSHSRLLGYLESVEKVIHRCRHAYVEQYTEEILTPERANLRIRIRFEQGHLLEINEAVVVVEDALVPLDYRYHCQDVQNHLIFRYDSTPHFPDLSSFPHHKHIPDDVIASEKPTIEQAVRKRLRFIEMDPEGLTQLGEMFKHRIAQSYCSLDNTEESTYLIFQTHLHGVSTTILTPINGTLPDGVSYGRQNAVTLPYRQ